MGSNRMGHDLWAQFTNGARISLDGGLRGRPAGVRPGHHGGGITAGYFGGVVDECLTFLMNVVLVIPNLPCCWCWRASSERPPHGDRPHHRVDLLGLWCPGHPRPDPGPREKEFVIAAEVLGEPAWRIILVEILPNLISIIGVSFIGSIIYAIVTEATLEFLGLGDPTVVSWGIMPLQRPDLERHPGGRLVGDPGPCFAIATLGAGLAMLNFAIDEIANPQLRSHKGLRRWKQLATPITAQEKTA